ncbi:MAG: AIR synthase-related protein, partial [bacterium]|nr:AIR synthase-related protein [bacterium]
SKVPQAANATPYVMILFGKSTDSTGFGGASFSSAVLDEDDEMANLGAVQVHDPFMKRMVVAAIKVLVERVHAAGVEIGFKDLGAGGISCAASELASAGGFGCDLNLDDVNVAIDGLSPQVIACSETQERFCVAVPESFAPEVVRIFNEEFELPSIYPNAGAAIIGRVTAEPRFIMRHQGKLVCDLSVTAITTEVLADRKIEARDMKSERQVDASDAVLASGTWGGNPNAQITREALQAQLASLTHSSKRYVYRNFDNAVRGDTVVYPGEADAVVVTPIDGCDAGLAVTIDSNTYGNLHPYLAAACAVAESVRNVVAVGGRPMAVTDCLNYGNPEIPNVLWDFKEGLRGIKEAAEALSFIKGDPIPIISGNVSFYNESKSGNAVVASPVIVVVGKMSDYRQARTMQLRQTDSTLIHIQYSGALLQLDKEAKQNAAVLELIQAGKVRSCHDISQGGTWQCVVEMMLGERGVLPVGVALDFTGGRHTELLAENGGFVLEVATDGVDKLVSELLIADVDARILGVTNSSSGLSVSTDSGEIQFQADELLGAWNSENERHVGVRV